MSDKTIDFANKDVKLSGVKPGKLNPKDILGKMPKNVSKRWMIVFGVLVVAMTFGATVMSAKKQRPEPGPVPVTAIDTSPKGLTAKSSTAAMNGAEVLALKKQLDAQAAGQTELLARMAVLQGQLAAVQKGGGNDSPGKPTTSRLDLTLPPPPEAPKTLSAPTGQAPQPPKQVTPMTQPTVAPVAVKRAPARAFIPESATAEAGSSELVVDEMIANDRKGYLPAGSFIESSLISGVEAFTGGTAQSQPQPIVIRLNENAVLPNAAAYQIKGCHVLASAWGDMSSERVFARLAHLTCVDSENQLVLSEDVEGVLVDSDGKNGIRGSLQDRQGAKLARSLLAGFAQGVSSAFGNAQSTVTSTGFGTTSMITGGNVMRAGGYGGAETAANQLAQFYLKQAEATMPVIAVDAGRKVSVLITKSKALKFESTAAFRSKPKTALTVQRGN